MVAPARRSQVEPKAFAELVREHRGRVEALALRITRNRADAEDVSQEVFLRAYRALPRFRGDAEIGTWLYRITVNTALNHLRRRTPLPAENEHERWDPSPGPEDEAQASELRSRLREGLDRIPPKQRAVLTLRLQQERSFAEIARIMGTRVGTAKANYFHAVRKLRAAMEDLR